MLRTLTDWLGRLTEAGQPEEGFSVADPRLSVAAILVHIIAVDGIVTEEEKAGLNTVLREHYGLSEAETKDLIAEAERRDDEAVDLYSFTSILKRELDEEGRRQVVLMMWEMVYADGVVSEFEDNIVWRVAELIGVSSRDRVTLRKEIEERQAKGQ
ncbi:TerB family tellurite resistance protein [Acuticoccus sp. I52.16.1]|uniref:tellurite resistance TerB family protein n=1 Tax=Acuticoccus sp. I52.16.1 TaxID=2928472 RepID=UPI001FD4EEA0|nr:TerB family tellurite resistance protein [Acuticoccus sp. I52.16.1]UOM33430.1 TerB family tellurite resistance protein [Acuticoccus sp. I52.16.1]